MFKYVLLFLTLSGLQALPISDLRRKSPSTYHLPDGFRENNIPDNFREDAEFSRRLLGDLNTNLVKDYINEIDRRVVPVDVPAQRNGGGWVRAEDHSASHLPDGFSQGTEPRMSIMDGFSQGTEPRMSILDGFRQGTEPLNPIPDDFKQGTEPSLRVPDDFRQGTEPSLRVPVDFRQGTEPSLRVPDGFKQGTEPSLRVPDGFKQGTEPSLRVPDGFRQGTEPLNPIPDGFKQGTEPSLRVPDGFKQGTEPSLRVPDDFRQGTEPSLRVPDGFKQGTEPSFRIPDTFRQGTEPSLRIPDDFRQGTEPSFRIPDTFRQGTEPSLGIPNGFVQGTEPSLTVPLGFRQKPEPSAARIPPQFVVCKGETINGKCFEFNPTPLSFREAQTSCRSLAPKAELASVTSGDLHSRLVFLVTQGGKKTPALTWLGAMVKNQQASWVDGSEWSYSDWMPGHPNIHTDKPACVEMFRIDESWWTVADCELKRASICSYPIAA
ncbi:RNA-binding protein 12B-like [Melanotaenia boesemani]|uniref:RNA-binding protein 12B-like n=1 Tax=Melanotaenia boesemani TaxID=1250792 RepID=UPI001C055311|nr:RNA-binding protein 12B-like [Melanotaenia boesemani]